MSTIEEIKEIPEKYQKYRDELIELFKKYGVYGIQSLINNYKNNLDFKEEWSTTWVKISKEDGGKLSLTTIGIIIGSAMGGVGIAAMGSAVGLPLALVLGLGGFFSGSKIDSLKFFGSKKSVKFKISKDTHQRLIEDAGNSDLSTSDFVEQLIEIHYTQNNK